jgi:hypothetical protein
MEQALSGLKDGVVPSPEAMGSFSDLQAAVGFPEYFREEARWGLVRCAPVCVLVSRRGCCSLRSND